MLRPQRVVLVQPFKEQVANFQRQPQQHVRRGGGAGVPRAGQDGFHFAVVEGRNHRGEQQGNRNSGSRQRLDACQPGPARGGPGLQQPLEVGVQGGNADRDRAQPVRRHVGKDIDIPGHQCTLGDDGHRVAVALQHLQQLSGDAVLFLNRLVRVGIGAQCDAAAGIARARQLPLELGRGIALVREPGFKVDPRRQVEVGVGRAGIAVDATVLTALVGVDRLAEGNVG